MVRREVWFDEKWEPGGADLLVFYHRSEILNPEASADVHSLEIDLTQDEAALWKGIAPRTRTQINRAAKEGITVQSWTAPTREIINEFFSFLRQFAFERDMNPSCPVWMHAYAEQGALILSRACEPDGRPLVWHSYSRTPGWVRQLHSVSFAAEAEHEERRHISWANRYLHWMDMLECRRLGAERFDFGGWYAGGTDEKLLRVNAFKEEFGGRRTHRYNSMLPASGKGKLYLLARGGLKRQTGLVHYV